MNGPETKSRRIANLLEAEIRSGVLHKGAALSSEKTLVERFSVSRTTVRKALEILTAKDLIRTRSGIGSFVTYGGAIIDSGPGWTVALSDQDTKIGSRILRVARTGMDLQATAIAPGEDVLAVDRIRFRQENGKALTLERARVPWRDGFEDFLENGLVGGSLNRSLQQFGLVPEKGEEWANVLIRLGAKDAAIMGRKADEPMLRLRRLTRRLDDTIVEYVESLLAPELFALHMEF